MRCRLYIDEVGNADLSGANSRNERYLSLTGVIAKLHHHDERIAPELEALKTNIFGVNPPILHRRDIIRADGKFSVLRDNSVRNRFDEGLLHLFDKLPYLAITVVIDKLAHREKYSVWHFDPYHYCARALIERYVLWLNRHGFVGDVMAEARFKKVDKRMKQSFQRTYEHGTENIPPHIIQKCLTSREIKLEPKGANVAGLQICDLLAHPSFVGMWARQTGESMKARFGRQLVEILERKKYSRNPQTGQIDGWGRKWLP